ncbi:hypothetical protein [Flavobacterium piscis]|uniref:Uncharacterized protein n=1 Tax=Flavobacterium piscis TaxID=1114874 RepID=A0ABU1Y8J2_9FLAO|nr:hypothetical protein [Flavobacterium piscis]MDR7209950.1 hypothetical protein [Flavobacterium piscis]
MAETLLKFFKVALISKFSNKNKEITTVDSYCSLLFSFNNFNEPKVFLNHVGEEKLENVSITIFDSEKIKQINHLENTDGEAFIMEYKKCSNKYHFEVIYPNALYPNIPIDLDKSKTDIDLIVDIRFGNRILNQTISIENYKSPDRIIKNKIEENGRVVVQSETAVRQMVK